MSDIARLALTVVSYAVSLLTGLWAVGLVSAERRRSGRALRRWQQEGGAARPGAVDELVGVLLGSPFERTSAVAMVLISLLSGALGHFLGL